MTTNTQDLVDKISPILVSAGRANEDIGDLVAAALHDACYEKVILRRNEDNLCKQQFP